ncbi:HEAT domain-containing protein, partial [Oryctes borbonicus]
VFLVAYYFDNCFEKQIILPISEMDVKEIFDLVQHEPKNCNKYLKMLHNLYIKEEFSNFFASFNKHLLQAFLQPFPNCFAKAVISFASSFCLEIVTNFEKQMQHMENGEYESHPFFVHLIAAVLKCIPVDDNNVRYHASLLLAMLFTNFGPDISISDVICDKIQRAMLERAEDLKPHIRLQAITVLTRLQNPHDVNCPIIQRFINSLGDPSPLVRKAVVESIAPCRGTFLHIITRLRDVDGTVRASTYTKLLKVSPKIISIVNRQTILMNGFTENNEALQKKFKNVLLTKWLDVYENNVIEFMRALKLDANEEDLKQTEEIYELLLPIIFTMMPLQELIQLLGLDESKMIPTEELTIEKVTYWSCLISNLLNISDSNVDFEENIPTVVSMVTCIENFVKMKSDTSLELWQYFEYQQTLRKLFELILKLDNSDEFGRQKIRKLLEYVLTKVKMEPDVLNIVIKAFHNILPDTEQLAYEICSIITDIKDPLEPLELPIGVRREQDVQIAQLKVKHHMKTDELKKAIDEKQYEIVDKLSKEAAVFETQIKELQTKFAQPILVRKPHNDVEIICRCLDIAISFLEVLPIEKLPNSLVTFKEEFLTNNDIDIRYATIFQRIFKLSCLYSMIDRDAALQSLEGICAPVSRHFNRLKY